MTTATPTLAALRRAVHAACRAHPELADDDTRRDMLQGVAGVRSTTLLTIADCHKVLDHLNGQNEWRFVFAMPPDRRGYLQKIYRLAEWIGPRLTPPVPVASVAYIEGIAKQMGGYNRTDKRPAFATPLRACDADRLHKIVQALEMHKRRHA